MPGLFDQVGLGFYDNYLEVTNTPMWSLKQPSINVGPQVPNEK